MHNRFRGQLTTLLVITFLAGATISCGDSPDNKESAGLPGLPDQLRNELLQTCDYVDIIFYNSPASMSQDEPQSIRRALGFIGEPVNELDKACKPIGRISYISSGEITAEGDIYLSEKCRYIVFMKDNEAIYANVLSTPGVQFFQQIMQGINNQLPNQ